MDIFINFEVPSFIWLTVPGADDISGLYTVWIESRIIRSGFILSNCASIKLKLFSAKMYKAHNDANMLSLGERVLGRGLALEIVDAWINTEFEGDRHSKRVNMIKEIEERYNK